MDVGATVIRTCDIQQVVKLEFRGGNKPEKENSDKIRRKKLTVSSS